MTDQRRNFAESLERLQGKMAAPLDADDIERDWEYYAVLMVDKRVSTGRTGCEVKQLWCV